MNTLRHVLDGALAGLGVAEQPREDIGLIVSETWANVIARVRLGVAFQVRATVDENRCVIEVTNPADLRACGFLWHDCYCRWNDC